MTATVSALILAGGKATRLGGIAKHEIVIDGETIFARQVKLLAPCAEIIVSGPSIAGYRNVVDSVEGAGPLAGIAAGLAACQTRWLLVIAGDMPHVSQTLVLAMIAVAMADVHDELDVVGVQSRGLPEPLLCVLHQRALPVIERMLAAGQYKTSRLLTDQGLRVEWLRADPDDVRNINSPEDLGAERGSK